MKFLEQFKPIEMERVNLVRLPSISFTKEEMGALAERAESNEQFLQQLTNDGWKKFRDKVSEDKRAVYLARIREEFEIVKDLGFIDYYLLVWKVINKARQFGAFIDWGRGSAAGSLIFFLIGVTGVDPIEKKLFFTRFISKTRAKKEVIDGITYIQGDLAPDVDINLGGVRDQIINWLKEEYPNKVCKISSVTTFSGKILVKDVFKIVDEASEEDASHLADTIGKTFGVVEDIEDAYKNSEKFKDWAERYPESYAIALKLRNLIRSKSTHPSGYFISYYPLDKFVPVEFNKEGDLAISYEMTTAAKFGIKLDLLGLLSNEIIKKVFELIPEKLEDINLDDNPEVYTHLQREDLLPYGLYQISADCAYRVCQKIKPANINELSDVNAIARPGALQYESAYVNNIGEPPHELFRDILSWTRYQPLYQEQSIQMGMKIGLSADESEELRRCVTGDTKFISKTRGWITINTLLRDGYENDLFLVMDENGRKFWKKITNIWSNGIKQVTHVTAKNGLMVRASFYHQFLTDSGWKSRSRLVKGDSLVCPRSVEWDGQDLLPRPLSRIIVGILCEGTFLDSSECTFVAWDKAVMESFRADHYEYFGEDPKFDKLGRIARISRKNKKELHKYFAYGKSSTKRLPESLMACTKPLCAEILALFFTYEGGICREKHNIYMTASSASKEFLSQIQLLLLRFGIYSNFYSKYNKIYQRDYYHLDIKNSGDLLKFQREIAPHMVGDKKKILLGASFDPYCRWDMWPHYIVSKLFNQYPKECGEFYRGGRIYKNRINRSDIESMVKLTNDKNWKYVLGGDHYYNEFKGQENNTREVEVFDFTVDEDTPFIVANGIIIHNCIGKKKISEVPLWKEKIYAKCDENDHPKEAADAMWNLIEASASYQFNASHSYSCAYLGALTVYLKYKYPIEFFTSCLNASQRLPDTMGEIRQIEQELPYFNIKLLPPHLLKSGMEFTVEGGSIRYGLSAIKGISSSAMEKLVKFRGEYDNKIDCFMAAKQAGLNIGVLSALIQAGALDELGSSRTHLVLQAQSFNILTDKEKRLVKTMHDEGEEKNILNIIQLLVDKKQIKQTRFDTFKRKYSPYKEIFLLNKRNEKLTNYFYEKNCLGFSYSQNLTEIFKTNNRNFITIRDAFDTKEENDSVLIIGEITEPTRLSKSRNDNKFFKATVADDTGKVSVLMFDGRFGLFEECKTQNGGAFPEEGDIVIAKGRLKGTDAIFADHIVKQDCKIYKNMRDLK